MIMWTREYSEDREEKGCACVRACIGARAFLHCPTGEANITKCSTNGRLCMSPAGVVVDAVAVGFEQLLRSLALLVRRVRGV